jgi:hypothetical protein
MLETTRHMFAIDFSPILSVPEIGRMGSATSTFFRLAWLARPENTAGNEDEDYIYMISTKTMHKYTYLYLEHPLRVQDF